MLAEKVTAEQALSWGMVHQVVPAAELMAGAERYAELITRGAPLSVIAIKEAITHGLELPLEEGLRLEAELAQMLGQTDDQKEGSRAFAEKREPLWKGR